MRLPRPGIALAALAVAATVGLSYETIAQRVTQAAVETWVDGLLAEMRRAGATDAKRGAVTYNASTGALTISDLAVTTGGTAPVQITVSRVAGTNVQSGTRFQAATLNLEGVVARLANDANARVGVERVAFERLDMPVATPATFSGAQGGGLGGLLRDTSVGKITVPVVAIRSSAGNTATEMALNGFTFENIQRGVAQTLRVGEQTLSMRDPVTGPINMTVGASTGEAVDVAIVAEIIAPAPNAARERRLAYGRYTVGEMTIELPDANTSVEIGETTVRNVFMTPPRTGYMELLAATQRMEAAGATPSPEAMRDLGRVMQDYLNLFTMEALQIASVSVTAGDTSVSTGEIAGREIGSTRYGSLSVKEIEFEGALQGKVGEFAIRDLDFGQILALAFEEMGRGNIPDPRVFEGKLPRIGAIELTGLSVESPGTDPVTMNRFAFEMGQWRGYVPDRLALAIRALQIPEALIPTQPPRPRDLGYQSFNISSDIRLSLEEAAKRAVLSPGRIAFAEMGAVELEVSLRDVDSAKLGFEGLSDPGPLLQTANVDRLRLRIENAGLLEKMSEFFGRQQRVPPATLRQTLVMSMAPMLPMLIQDPASQQRAQQALQTFSQTPRALTFVITPKAGQRVTLAEVMAMVDAAQPPLAMLARVDVAVTAND